MGSACITKKMKSKRNNIKVVPKMCFYKLYDTFNWPGNKVRWGLSLLDPVALHYLSLLGETKEPGPTWLLLSVHSGRVDHIVVLKNWLLELTLWGEHLLQKDWVKEGKNVIDICQCKQKIHFHPHESWKQQNKKRTHDQYVKVAKVGKHPVTHTHTHRHTGD